MRFIQTVLAMLLLFTGIAAACPCFLRPMLRFVNESRMSRFSTALETNDDHEAFIKGRLRSAPR